MTAIRLLYLKISRFIEALAKCKRRRKMSRTPPRRCMECKYWEPINEVEGKCTIKKIIVEGNYRCEMDFI